METPRWRLDQLYPALDSREFRGDVEDLGARIDRATSWFDANDISDGEHRPVSENDRTTAAAAIERLNDLGALQRRARAFVHALVTTDTRNDEAAKAQGQMLPQSGDIMRLHGRFAAWIGRLDGSLLEDSDELSGHAEFLHRSKVQAQHRMSDDQEDLALDLGLTGGSAWVRMRNDLAGRLTANVSGEVEPVPLAVVRGRATDPDIDTRDRALTAELEMWAANAVPFAAALNAHKGESISLNRRRGWSDDLEPILVENGIDQQILEAMTTQVVAALPDFRRFCQAKSRLIGRTNGLDWADLVAPVGAAEANIVGWSDAVLRVTNSFGTFSPALERLATQAFDEGWIDAEPRDGKQGGAFCMPVEGDVSRVLMNFDGSADSIQTLAHELGHAFHNVALGPRTDLQRRTPRALAETASIFCETVVVEALLDDADAATQLALLNTDLSGSTQVVVDIHSRFLFEQELYRRRATNILTIDELNELMIECQDAAYGDGLAADSGHPYMWAVKAHYFTPFYNFPYTFGLLFGLGLYERYVSDPDTFRQGYDDLLSSTGMERPVDLAAKFGIDIRDGDFWAASLSIITRRIDRFIDLADAES